MILLYSRNVYRIYCWTISSFIAFITLLYAHFNNLFSNSSIPSSYRFEGESKLLPIPRVSLCSDAVFIKTSSYEFLLLCRKFSLFCSLLRKQFRLAHKTKLNFSNIYHVGERTTFHFRCTYFHARSEFINRDESVLRCGWGLFSPLKDF